MAFAPRLRSRPDVIEVNNTEQLGARKSFEARVRYSLTEPRHRGVNLVGRTWMAALGGLGPGYIGVYKTYDEAVAARQQAELAAYGYIHASPEPTVVGEIAKVPLLALDGSVRGWSVIDVADVPLVRPHRWFMQTNGYARTCAGGHAVGMHCFLLDAPPGVLVDHISGDTLDNRRANLRLCNDRENSLNSAPSGAIPYKGVCRRASGRYRAAIQSGRLSVWLGVFDTAEEAARAYDAAAVALFGEFARLNFPDAPRQSASHYSWGV